MHRSNGDEGIKFPNPNPDLSCNRNLNPKLMSFAFFSIEEGDNEGNVRKKRAGDKSLYFNEAIAYALNPAGFRTSSLGDVQC